MARVFSYKLVRDYGFAPNPYGGCCTLATCKPQIRAVAQVGDLIIGSGSKQGSLAERAIFALVVGEKLTFDEYWVDDRFQIKKPVFNGSRAEAFGDNIYHRENGVWIQSNSHHSHVDGTTNELNLDRDTSQNHIIISRSFVYWGASAAIFPEYLRDCDGDDIYPSVRAHRSRFSPEMIRRAYAWFNEQPRGLQGRPSDW
ncbi:hypothetical protein ABZR86_17575 [Dyella marensis]|nr:MULTISPECIES: hypothetical protein [Dyella]